ncbi:hypothetical protein GmHk_07G019929 [Glycine max]|nr:hypothetical protein GmHk_07G019929 [Glycine max]
MHHKGELWAKVLDSKYGGWRGLAEVDRVGHKCIWWRDLQKVLFSTNSGQLIQKGLKWKVGSGDHIKFCEDKWTGEEDSLAEKYPRLYSISLQQHQLIRSMGMYQDMGAYDLIGQEATDNSQEECFEKLWRIKVPARFPVFAWRLLRDRLPTRKNLQRRQIQLTDSLCPLCKTQQEDASHLFFHCNKVQPIWWETKSWLQVKGVFPLSPQQHFLHHLGVQPAGVRKNRWHCWWLALTWSIWKLRNSIVFSNVNFDANNLFEEAIFLLWSWLRGFEKDFTVHFNHWSSNLPQSFMYQQGIA